MSDSPEQVIRRYLDQHGGETNATVGHLLSTFGIDEDDHSGRDRIKDALSRAGVGMDRPLPFLDKDQDIRLFTEESGGIDAAPSNVPNDQPVGDRLQSADQQVSGSAESQRPAAWYPDPSAPGQLRWWDGGRWTDHVQAQRHSESAEPQSPRASAQPMQPTQASRSPKQDWYKRPWVIVAGAILAIAIIASAFSSSEDKGGGGQAEKSSDASGGSGNSDSSQSEPKSTKATDDNTPHVGPKGNVTVDGLVYSIPSARTASTLGDPSIGTDAKAAGVFVLLKVRVHSTKGETTTLTDDTIKLEAKNSSVYSADTEGSTAALLVSDNADSKPFFLEDIQPDTTTTGTIVFDVPRTVVDTRPEVRFNELGFGSTHGYIRLPSL